VRAVVQRVHPASAVVEGRLVGTIENGLLAYVGVAADDTDDDVRYVANKIVNLRVFEDENGMMNRSLIDLRIEAVERGEIPPAVLAVSQFTLFGDVRKGRRPSYNGAAGAEIGRKRFDELVAAIRKEGVTVETGTFQARMMVASTNEGPVTILVDSRKVF
jgi:D-tyrosyl-tRNA(Tyr) deacylase